MYMDIIDADVIEKLNEYKDKFNEGFPTMCFDGIKKDLIKQINKCIKKNKKYVVYYAEDEDS